MKMYGLGAACFSPIQLYQLALSAGFPPGATLGQGNAGTMAAIAMRESNGCPDQTNIRAPGTLRPDDPGEHSYGLWQINIDTPGLLDSFGLTDPSQLLDPQTNAAAAYQMWGGSDSNLGIAWYVGRGGENDKLYQANLVAIQAMLNTGTGVPGLGDGIVPVVGGDTLLSSGVVIAAVAAVGLLLFLDRR